MTDSPDAPNQPSPPVQPPPTYPPQQYPPGTYPAPPAQPYAGYAAPPASPRNGLGITSLVLAIIGLVTSASVVLGIILGFVAVILGFMARGRVKRGEATNGGVAMAGILLGLLSIIAGVAFIFIYIALFNGADGRHFVNCMKNAGGDPVAERACEEAFQQNLEDKFSVTLTPTP